ncbi:MAG: glycosyl hydrolase family 95 catalytic domain-containing protein, partial [Bacteroidaceae bacterium]
MKTKLLIVVALCALLASCNTATKLCKTTPSNSDLKFDRLATSWDEGIPLGNATIGSLVWQNKDALRLSLDRTDLWDLRPLDSLAGDRFKFAWVKQQIKDNNYGAVQRKFDHPYNMEAAPSKIPGAALEFLSDQLNGSAKTHLFINEALCEVTWQNGVTMQTFVHATQPVGWFIFKNLKKPLEPTLKTPVYQSEKKPGMGNSLTGQSLERLGYPQGTIERNGNSLVYHQKGHGDFHYEVAVRWQQIGETMVGTWSVTSSLSNDNASQLTADAMKRGFNHDYATHKKFWQQFYAQSSVCLPDTILQKQYDNEMYKFGSAAREDSYPISLQAVWTADNGHLPPWKGDYHHDLNTQLSYWPAYIGNHLTEESGYLNTLWNQREQYRKFTRQYFETDGLNVPGVCTLDGQPMGGWLQYSMSQTTGAWIAQHFYLHWKYSADREFLRSRAYPFIKEVATYMEQQSHVDNQGKRCL